MVTKATYRIIHLDFDESESWVHVLIRYDFSFETLPDEAIRRSPKSIVFALRDGPPMKYFGFSDHKPQFKDDKSKIDFEADMKVLFKQKSDEKSVKEQVEQERAKTRKDALDALSEKEFEDDA